MARILTWDATQEAQWAQWVSTRPPIVQALCHRLPPYLLYRLKPQGHRCTIFSYEGNGTVTVDVTGEYNAVLFDRHVFGVKPEDLEECELPPPDEWVGIMLTNPEDVDLYVELVRQQHRENTSTEQAP